MEASRLKNAIGPQLRRLRNARDMSHADLASRAQRMGWDIERAIIGKIESGIRRVSDREVFFLAELLDIGIEDLFPPKKEMHQHHLRQTTNLPKGVAKRPAPTGGKKKSGKAVPPKQ